MTGNQEFMLYDGLISLVGNMLWYVVLIIVCWLIYRARRNADNKNAEIIMKAIETNSTVDADKLTIRRSFSPFYHSGRMSARIFLPVMK